jgi:hypothetical protein
MQLLKIDKATHPSVGPLWAKFQNAVAPTVSYRHKVIGHIDLPTAIGQAAQPQVLIRHVLQSMELLESLMNAIELAAFNSTTSYDINLSGDGHTIVRCVRKSRNYADLAVEYFYARPAEVDATALLARIRDDNYS